jgi:hypothetical protein
MGFTLRKCCWGVENVHSGLCVMLLLEVVGGCAVASAVFATVVGLMFQQFLRKMNWLAD